VSWPRACLAVPTRLLQVDSQYVSATPKATPQQLQQWMGSVPQLYRLQADGLNDADFRRFVDTPRNEQERMLGETYRHLFSTSPSAQPLRADFVEGRGLVVESGQHRVLAAKEAGVPVVPVHVAAPDWPQLEKLRDTLGAEVRTLGSQYQRVPDLHRQHDEHRYREAREDQPKLHIGRERTQPEPERNRLRPERER
jgi:hypothetical protein